MHLTKLTEYFEGKFEQICMNSRIKTSKFEPNTTFENNIYEIKADHKKIIASLDMNVSSITPNKPSSSFEHLNANFMQGILLK